MATATRRIQTKRKQLLKKVSTCCYCGIRFDECKFEKGRSQATLEHIVPLELGGGWNASNLDLACEECNSYYSRMHCIWKEMKRSVELERYETFSKYAKELYWSLKIVMRKPRRVRNGILDVWPFVRYLKEEENI